MKTPKFKVNDEVVYTNNQGVVFKDKIVTEITNEKKFYGKERYKEDDYMYYLSFSDSPWMPVKEKNLHKNES